MWLIEYFVINLLRTGVFMTGYNNIFKKFISFFLIIIFLLAFTSPILAAEKDSFRAAKIEDLTGDVKVTKSGGEKSFIAFKGMSLAQGDTITTGRNSTVNLFIDEDKEVKIAENTKLYMSQLSGSIVSDTQKTGMKLWFGKIYANVKKKLNIRSKFEIKTPTTVAGIRGTQFYVGQEDGKTDLAVLEGTIIATTYIPSQEQPSGTPQPVQEIETIINANEQVTIDPEVLAQQPHPQIIVEPEIGRAHV